MAIKIITVPVEGTTLVGKSHWWGFPDLPADVEWPSRPDGELLTFICQINLADVAHLDTVGELPHEGMLWFFADVDYFLGDMDAICEGMGEWDAEAFKVIYSPGCSTLHTHEYYWEDGSSAVLPAESILFEPAGDEDYVHRLLGQPTMTEGYENENEGLLSLLQIDEDERWQLRFFDCGMINFMIPVDALARRDFSEVMLCLHSS